MDEAKPAKELQRQVRTAMTLLCFVVTFNLAIIGFSFTQWFSGTANMPGFADRVLGDSRSGGFRLDFVWMLVSNVGLFFVLAGCVVRRKNRLANVAGSICLIELGAFLLYIFHGLMSGVFYMG